MARVEGGGSPSGPDRERRIKPEHVPPVGADRIIPSGFGEQFIPGPEEALRKGTELAIGQVKKLVEGVITAENVAKVAEQTQAKGVRKIVEFVRRKPDAVAKAGKYALGPAGYIAAEAASHYLDTGLADTLKTIGGVHFDAAHAELADARNASTESGKRTHRERAAGHIGAAYHFREKELSQREGKTLPKQDQITAHREATNAALILAAINRCNPDTHEAVERWAENARDHLESYVDLATSAAKNGERLNYIGGTVGSLGAAVTPLWLLTPVVAGSARMRIEHHKQRVIDLEQDRKEFDELYTLLVPPQEPPHAPLPPTEKN